MRECWWWLLPLGLGLCVSAGAKTINVPKDQPTIQAGINAALNGDQVVVAAGTYFENINFKGKAIQVISSDGPGTTIIDGGHKDVAVLFHSGETRASILSGFTITHGGPATTNESICGGVGMEEASPEIIGNVITENDCHGMTVLNSWPLIEGNVVSNTHDVHSEYVTNPGVGIYADNDRGGLDHPGVSIIGNTIEDNNQNDAYTGGGYSSGGGVFITHDHGTVIEKNVIRNNGTFTDAGGITVGFMQSFLIFQNQIYHNYADGYGDGGIAVSFSSVGGPGPFRGLIANNTLWSNHKVPDLGTSPEIDIADPESYDALVNNIILSDSSSPAVVCPSFSSLEPMSPAVFDHNDILNSVGTAYSESCGNRTGTYGNISVDPMFIDAAAGNFQLTAGSPAIDAGNTSVLETLSGFGHTGAVVNTVNDASGAFRVQDGSGKGYAAIDMGAFEFAGKQNTAGTTLVVTPNVYEAFANTPITMTVQAISSQGIPTGDVVLFEDGVELVRASLNGGMVSITLNLTSAGVHGFVAKYAGQGEFEPGESVMIYALVDGRPTSLTCNSSLNPSVVGQAVGFGCVLASSSNAATGAITFTDVTPNTVLGTVKLDSQGTVSLTTSSLAEGTHDIRAAYAGDSVYGAATADVQQVVTVTASAATTTALSSSLNPATVRQVVTFSAAVTSASGTPDGMVTFLDGTAVLGTVQLSAGTATFATVTLAVGTHPMTAVYLGNGTYKGSTSAVLEQVIGNAPAGDFAVNISPGARTVFRGTKATVAVAVTSEGGFSGTVALSCSGLPAESSCAFAPETISGSGRSTLAIVTADWHPETADGRSGSPWRGAAGGGLVLGFAVMLLPRRWRRRGGYLACLGLIAMACGCGSLKLVGGTPPGTYAVQVTGTAVIDGQTVRHSATETLTVKKF